MNLDQTGNYDQENQNFQNDETRFEKQNIESAPADHSTSNNAEPDFENDLNSEEFNNGDLGNEKAGNNEFDNDQFNGERGGDEFENQDADELGNEELDNEGLDVSDDQGESDADSQL